MTINKHITTHRYKSKIVGKTSNKPNGFSLIELMVSLTLGLLIMGIIVTVFASSQQTSRVKQEMDRAQEAFRFASHTIMRVVQQGVIQEPQASRDRLVVVVSRGSGHKDCLGRPIDSDIVDSINTFFINDRGQLRCRVLHVRTNPTHNTSMEETIVDGIDSSRTQFTFGIHEDSDEGYWSNNTEWKIGSNDEIDWVNVRSVRIILAMESNGEDIGPRALFSATMRCGALDIC